MASLKARKPVTPAEAGVQTCPCESREPYKELSGFPLEFTPYLIRGGNDGKSGIAAF